MTSRNHFIPNFELRSVALLATLAVGAALAAHAQTTDSGTPRPPTAQSAPSTGTPVVPGVQNRDLMFARADVNKDGKLSRQESARFPALEQRFDDIDTNKDQFVSREEFDAALKS